MLAGSGGRVLEGKPKTMWLDPEQIRKNGDFGAYYPREHATCEH